MMMLQWSRWVVVVAFGLASVGVHSDATAQQASPDHADALVLFDGESLAGWAGDERFWRVEDNAIVGETTDDNPAPNNTFLIYVGPNGSVDEPAEFADFVLEFDYQVRGFNSGMQYRSRVGDDFTVTGYQADFEATWHDGNVDKFTGMFFEEGGRMFIGQRGQAVLVRNGGDKANIELIGQVGDAAELAATIRRDDWNHYKIIADGHAMTHVVNDRVFAMGIDEDETRRADAGVFALQLHSGKPMQIRVKDIHVRTLHDHAHDTGGVDH